MNKKNYQKPSMKVVKLTHAPLLQGGSGGSGGGGGISYLGPIDADMNYKA